jgi:ankyrin repeat protein
LHIACREGHLSIVEYLLEHDVKIDATDADGWTPVHYACARGHFQVLQAMKSTAHLLAMRVNTGVTCLHLAVQQDNPSIVNFILDQFSNSHMETQINDMIPSWGTPLHVAGKHLRLCLVRSDVFLPSENMFIVDD